MIISITVALIVDMSSFVIPCNSDIYQMVHASAGSTGRHLATGSQWGGAMYEKLVAK